MRRILIVLLISSPLMAQLDDFAGQLQLISELLPDATTVGIIWNPQNVPDGEQQFADASAKTGLRVIQTPLRNVREISGVMKALAPYNVSFIYLVEDRLVTGKNAIKFIVKAGKKRGIPVFSLADDITESGVLGQLVKGENGEWQLRVNGQTLADFGVTVPPGDDRFLVAP